MKCLIQKRVILLLTLFLIVFFISGCGHPSDQELITNFDDHRAEFEELLSMFQNDMELGLTRVGAGFTRPADVTSIGITEERIAEYYRLFKILSLPDGIGGSPGKTIHFHSSSSGYGDAGSTKGYIYTKAPADYFEQVEILDGYTSPGNLSYFDVIRDIGDGWYLYYDRY